MFKAILFDMDGVISNTEPIHEKADRKVLAEYGVELDDRWKQIKGLTQKEVFAKAVKMYKIKELPKTLVEKKMRYYMSLIKEVELFDGVIEILELLSKRYMLALVSSSPAGCVNIVVKRFGLDKFFKVIISGDDVQIGKPNPEPYLRTAKMLGVKMNECIVIEDSINGIISAKRAGAYCIGLTTSFNTNELMRANPDLIISDIKQLVAVIPS